MGKKIRTKKFAEMKRMLKFSDSRVKGKFHEKKKHKSGEEGTGSKKLKTNVLSDKLVVHDAPKTTSALFFKFNTQLGPPYSVLLDTNFVNFSLKNKLDIHHGLMDTLYAKCTVYVTDCVVGELERLGSKFAVALRIVNSDPRIRRLTCTHRGLYADDCIVDRVTAHRCFCVATCDKQLKRRLRKIPGVPIVYIRQHRYSVERLPDAFGAPAL